MLLPTLTVYYMGMLTDDQVRSVIDTLRLDEGPRTEGLGTKGSLAHRSFTDNTGTRLILDFRRVDPFDPESGFGWELGLHFDGKRPSKDTNNEYRLRFRGIFDQLGLEIVNVEPPTTADEVIPEEPPGLRWLEDKADLELDQLWMHLRLSKDAPREVKAIKLRPLVRARHWHVVSERLRREVEEFLRDT